VFFATLRAINFSERHHKSTVKMIICIAEKPSVGREIAQILGARSRHDGYYEGNGYAVTWTFGHFCTLKTPDDYTPDWKKWQLQTLPMIPEKFQIKLIGNKGVKKQFGIIKTLLKKATSVINCGDAGQEGELIQRWVLQHAKYKGPVQRLWISSLTAQAIRDGFNNLKPAADYNNLFYAGSSRAIGDWLLGMNATRAYTLKHGGYKQVLSIGRVQTPTLAMLVERYHEINNFKPEPYWELHTLYRETDFNYVKGRFEKKEDGEKLLAKVQDKPFEVIEVKKKNGKEYPPYLFDLTSLQVNCNKRFGFTADRTLKLVQSLYEQKVVTYPRVDTTYLPNDVYPKIPGILKQMSQYAQFTQSLLGKTIRKSAKIFNDKKVTDHHAIIPTGSEKSLGGDEQKVYDAIARRFLAAFYPDCLVAHTTVIGEVEDVRFKATGKEILDPGWRVLYPRKSTKNNSQINKTNQNSDDTQKKKGKSEEKILPEFKEGEQGSHEPTLVEKMTQPPKHYTEATLLRGMETAGKKVEDDELRDLMKANGIGRPSTRANIIETLFRRKYAFRQRKLIIASETGIQLIGQINNDLLKSAELTGQWEKKLREIEAGTHGAGQFIKDMKNMVSHLIDEVKSARANPKIAASAPPQKFKGRKNSKGKSTINQKISNTKSKGKKSLTEMICLRCRRGKLLKGKTAYGCSEYKGGCSFRLPFEFMGKKISDNQLGRLMKLGSTVTLKGFVKNGIKVNGKLIFDSDHQLKFQEDNGKANSRKKTTDNQLAKERICPQCKKGKILKGKTAYGCSNWKNGCEFKISFTKIREKLGTRPITKETIMAILTKLK